MSLQPMALFDTITAPGALVAHMAFTGSESLERLTPFERERFASAKRVWVGESLRERLNFTAKTVDFRRDFGELRLPYAHLWVEWPAAVGTEGLAAAAQCFEVPGQRDDEVSYLMAPWLFNTVAQGVFRGIPTEYDLAARVDIDRKSSEVLGVSGFKRIREKYVPLPENMASAHANGMQSGEALTALVDLLWPAFVAIGFMNCRNVRTERHERPQKTSKKQRRQRPPRLDYHTIVLPGTAAGSSSRDDGVGGTVRQHHVRGHFKTFTTDRPLMGQHVGTYWWGWQVRGNKENGEVISDYKVAAS